MKIHVILYFSWTLADFETACRQLGFQGGSWWSWVDRQPGFKPRLLFEEPNCTGTEESLFDCNWSSRQLGSGVCGKCLILTTCLSVLDLKQLYHMCFP